MRGTSREMVQTASRGENWGHRVEEVRRTKKRKKAGAGAPTWNWCELVGGMLSLAFFL